MSERSQHFEWEIKNFNKWKLIEGHKYWLCHELKLIEQLSGKIV